MWLILQNKEPGDFLICSGNVWSLQELVENVFENLELDMGQYVKHDDSLLRPVDLEIIYGDNSKAKELLGWNYNLSNQDLIARLIVEETRFIEWELQTA
jgi:GDPmannose 4,6-dehydratase